MENVIMLLYNYSPPAVAKFYYWDILHPQKHHRLELAPWICTSRILSLLPFYIHGEPNHSPAWYAFPNFYSYYQKIYFLWKAFKDEQWPTVKTVISCEYNSIIYLVIKLVTDSNVGHFCKLIEHSPSRVDHILLNSYTHYRNWRQNRQKCKSVLQLILDREKASWT